jgi:hypothetical protein
MSSSQQANALTISAFAFLSGSTAGFAAAFIGSPENAFATPTLSFATAVMAGGSASRLRAQFDGHTYRMVEVERVGHYLSKGSRADLAECRAQADKLLSSGVLVE